MVQQVRTNNSTVPFVRWGVAASKMDATIEQDAGRVAALARFTVMGEALVAAGAVTADVGNTGDGTVTGFALTNVKQHIPLVGNYNLEALSAGADGRVVGAVTPGGGNTGDGTVTAFAVVAGETPLVGTFTLECTGSDEGGTAAGTATAGAGDTGNGTASAVVAGDLAVEGDYVATCIDASVSGSEIFEVITPNGAKLENLTVGVAYLNEHFGITISDGAADFIVGDSWTIAITISHGGVFKLTDPAGVDLSEDITLPGTTGGTVVVASGGIAFTITDGATDFAIGDSFAMVIAVADGGVFKLEDPNGNLVATGLTMSGTAGGATTFYEGGLVFIITDGATDFATGDKFALAVTSVAKWGPLDVEALDGLHIPKGIFMGDALTAAAIVAGDVDDQPIIIGGNVYVDENQIVLEGSATLDTVISTGDTIRNELLKLGIISEDTIDISSYENA